MFHLQFHWYGLLIGIAVVVMIFLMEKIALENKVEAQDFWHALPWVLFGAVIGARIYHVLTDFHLYQNALQDVLKIWEGGLSIIGAVMGGVVGLCFFTVCQKKTSLFPIFLDISIFGLPIAQAVGRVGNYLNQELYGLPTNLPWGIFIDQNHRKNGFEQFSFFHPLFLYEALPLLLFAIILWRMYLSKRISIGHARIFFIYLIFYSVLRFFLDFLRVDKTLLLGSVLGVNQLVMIVIFFGSIVFLTQIRLRKVFPFLALFLLSVSLSGCQKISYQIENGSKSISEKKNNSSEIGSVIELFRLQDREKVILMLANGEEKKIEVVYNQSSIRQGLSDREDLGSDGMLFVFPSKQIPSFWMKKMNFDLDLVWINDFLVVGIEKNVPKPTASQLLNEGLLPTYSPQKQVNLVLEIKSGNSTKWGISEGVRIHLRHVQ